ncbi:MAG: Copper resistance protein [Gammaproteobacteria bacterium]|nr:Copper resistance protein [Gammaproteobacteria bacterium]
MPDGPDALSVAFRAISFVLLLNAAGITIFIAVFGHLLPDSLPTIAKLGWRLAIGALVFVAGHHTLEAARMAGEMSGLADPAMQEMTLRSSEGAAFAVRMVGLALVALGLRPGARSQGQADVDGARSLADTDTVAARVPSASPTPHGRGALALGITGAVLAVAAFTLTGHTSVTPHRPAAAALLTVHLLVVAFWLGSLLPLYLAASREPPPVAANLIDAFSRVAAWVVPVILLAGVGLTVLLVPDWAVFKQPYGQLLLAKIALFAVLMALATLNKWTFGPACARGRTRAFKQAVAVEYVLICAVLAITAMMTTFYSPEAP